MRYALGGAWRAMKGKGGSFSTARFTTRDAPFRDAPTRQVLRVVRCYVVLKRGARPPRPSAVWKRSRRLDDCRQPPFHSSALVGGLSTPVNSAGHFTVPQNHS